MQRHVISRILNILGGRCNFPPRPNDFRHETRDSIYITRLKFQDLYRKRILRAMQIKVIGDGEEYGGETGT